tara:strand:- start:916 stop:1512 length:597 start_codon:yes stop_codon:yes gene_type:complete
MEHNKDFQTLTKLISQVPGLGPRSARRMTLYLLQNKDNIMRPLAQALDKTAEAVQECKSCGNLTTYEHCEICTDVQRDASLICVVESVADVWAIERTRQFRGRYHVLGGLLSALNGVRPRDLNITGLVERAQDENVKEVILALSATVDGQSTAHFIQDQLSETGVYVSKLAHGVPVGGELDYLDEGTLSLALKSRSGA